MCRTHKCRFLVRSDLSIVFYYSTDPTGRTSGQMLFYRSLEKAMDRTALFELF